MLCLECGAPLREPKRPSRPVKFCPGNKCRSMWHVKRRRALIAEVDAILDTVRAKLDDVAALVKGLR